MPKNEKSFGSGLIFASLGAGLILYSISTLDTGTARQMGPGYFPIIIGFSLIICGAAILLTMKDVARVSFCAWPWREIFMILAAILIFAFGLRYIGFLLSSFLMVFIAACARRETGLLQAAVIAAGITFFSTAVFIWGLGVPLQLY